MGDPGNGYGDLDRKMAGALWSAETPAEADRIARANGLKDAADARAWLRERSPVPGTPRYRQAEANQRHVRDTLAARQPQASRAVERMVRDLSPRQPSRTARRR